MSKLDVRQKYELVMLRLMSAGNDRIMDGAFGTPGLNILNAYETENGYEPTAAGSWTNQAGLVYGERGLGLIGRDKDGYYFTGVDVDSVNWRFEKLPKGLTLKWIGKSFPSLRPLIDEVIDLRAQAHSLNPDTHLVRQPEYRDPNGDIIGGGIKAHIIDAQLIGRKAETMIDTFLTTATAHSAHSFFSSSNFTEAILVATLEPSGNIVVKTDVVNPRFHLPDCIRQDIILALGLSAADTIGLLKMFALRKVLQQMRATILEKWASEQAKKAA